MPTFSAAWVLSGDDAVSVVCAWLSKGWLFWSNPLLSCTSLDHVFRWKGPFWNTSPNSTSQKEALRHLPSREPVLSSNLHTGEKQQGG